MQQDAIYIGLGTNLGDRRKNLADAIALINTYIGNVIVESSVYETPPWGFIADTTFYNQVIKVTTRLMPDKVLDILLQIEAELGRKRNGEGYSSRPIDLDILFFGDLVIKTSTLVVPHPNLHNRRFVLFPMRQIAPDLIHPVFNKSIAELLSTCTDTSYCKRVY